MTPPPPSSLEREDSTLVRETLAGDRSAFDELVERYQAKIYGLGLGVTGSPDDAKDVAQNAFLKAYQSLSRFDPAYKFFSWLYRIALNEALNVVNQRRRGAPLDSDTPEPAPGPHRLATSRETGSAIRRAIAELAPDLRATIVLRHFQGLSYAEMGAVLEIPVDRVKSRLFSARVKLRHKLSELGLGPEASMLYAFCLLLGVLPVILFLLSLVALDSYKLVQFGVVLRLLALGGGVALVCMYLNPFLFELLGIDARDYSSYVAPVVEETLKGAAIVAALVRRRLGFLVDAAIWGFAIGAGFAAVENIHYFASLQMLEPALWTVRGFGTALMHGGATAIAAVISRLLTERFDSHRADLFLPGLAVAVLLHSAFNQFFLSPNASTLLLLLALPLTFLGVYWISERATQRWLGTGFDTDQDLLQMIHEDRLDESRIGRYLDELKSHFRPEVVADMLCLIRLHVELSIKAKGLLLMQKAGLEPPKDKTVEPLFTELRFLEGSIGRTGLIALHPIFHISSRDLWQLHMLGKKGGGLTNLLHRRR